MRHARLAALTPVFLVAIAPQAHARVDTDPPVLHAPAKASFTVGQQLDKGETPGCQDPDTYPPSELRLYMDAAFKWSAADASPVAYTLTQTTGANGEEPVLEDSTETSWSSYTTNQDGDCGGGNNSIEPWRLTATDSAGNSTTQEVRGGRMRLTQDGGRSDGSWYAVSLPTLTYQGRWSVAKCGCWMAGRVHRTTQRGAAVRLTFSHVDDQPVHVGLVMHTGPSRGSFRVLVDGERVATVDTHAAEDRARVLVWQRALPDSGHTVRLVASGDGRVDLDAVVTN